jgi:hypothetical protein
MTSPGAQVVHQEVIYVSSTQARRTKRVGRVSYCQHHGKWYLYFREGTERVRRQIGSREGDAAHLAAEGERPTVVRFPVIALIEAQSLTGGDGCR